MKKNLLKKGSTLLVVLTLLFASCEDIKDKIALDIPLNPPAIELDLLGNESDAVDGNSTATQKVAAQDEDIVLGQEHFNLGLLDALKEEGEVIDNLKELTFNEAVIEVVKPADYDLKTLLGLKMYFDNDLVAEVSDVNENTRKLTIKISQKDIKEYMNKETILVTIKGKQRPTVPKVSTKVYLKFTAKVGL